MRQSIQVFALFLGAFAFASCGGGGGSSSGGGTGGGGTPPTAQMSTQENQIAMDTLTAMNAWRAQQNPALPALAWHQAGAQVAFDHCLNMEARNFFAHVDPQTGSSPASRCAAAGITHDPQGSIDPTTGHPFVGENLYSGSGFTPTGQAAVNSWSTSPGHNTQMVAPNPVPGAQTMPAWTHCGIGVRYDGNTFWYTAVFFRNPN